MAFKSKIPDSLVMGYRAPSGSRSQQQQPGTASVADLGRFADGFLAGGIQSRRSRHTSEDTGLPQQAEDAEP